MNRIKILNVEIDNISQEELLAQLKKGVLVTPNVDDLIKHQHDKDFHRMASQAEFVYCDYHKNDETKIFLLGAKEGVGEIAKKRINKRIGREIVVDTYSPPFGFEKDEKECQHIIDLLRASSANVVLVGLGNPKQTKWIYRYKNQLPNIDVFLALGATIDFEAGNIKRAPKIFQRLALEWFYRLIKEPRRMYRRYLIDDMPFFWLLLKQKLGMYKDPFER